MCTLLSSKSCAMGRCNRSILTALNTLTHATFVVDIYSPYNESHLEEGGGCEVGGGGGDPWRKGGNFGSEGDEER